MRLVEDKLDLGAAVQCIGRIKCSNTVGEPFPPQRGAADNGSAILLGESLGRRCSAGYSCNTGKAQADHQPLYRHALQYALNSVDKNPSQHRSFPSIQFAFLQWPEAFRSTMLASEGGDTPARQPLLGHSSATSGTLIFFAHFFRPQGIKPE